MKGAVEQIETIVSSPIRVRILIDLNEEGNLAKQQIATRFDVSRTTRARNLTTLEEMGLIEETVDSYRITKCGQYVADGLAQLVHIVDVTNELNPILRTADVGDLDFEFEALGNANITVANPAEPYATRDTLVEAFERCRSVRGVLPIFVKGITDAPRRRAKEGVATFEIIVTHRAASRLYETDRYAQLVEDTLAIDGFEVFVYDSSTPYYLGLFEEAIHIGVPDESGVLTGILVVESSEIRNWATRVFEDYRSQAIPIAEWSVDESETGREDGMGS